MGSQTSKYLKKGMDYVTGSTTEGAETSNAVKAHSDINFQGTPFVLTRTRFAIFFKEMFI